MSKALDNLRRQGSVSVELRSLETQAQNDARAAKQAARTANDAAGAARSDAFSAEQAAKRARQAQAKSNEAEQAARAAKRAAEEAAEASVDAARAAQRAEQAAKAARDGRTGEAQIRRFAAEARDERRDAEKEMQLAQSEAGIANREKGRAHRYANSATTEKKQAYNACKKEGREAADIMKDIRGIGGAAQKTRRELCGAIEIRGPELTYCQSTSQTAAEVAQRNVKKACLGEKGYGPRRYQSEDVAEASCPPSTPPGKACRPAARGAN